jgi:putative ABC transport system permease protein
MLALGVSMLVGLIFGVLPARRAGRLDPVEALRHD